jgi:hypothetical protein
MNLKLSLYLIIISTGIMTASPKITGKLIDKETSKPVEFATLELLQLPDSSLTEAVRSDVNGVFTFEKGDSSHRYCLRIKHLSYKTLVAPVVKRPGSGVCMMGNVSMEAAVISMKEVVVNGAKIVVTEMADKTVYAVSEGIKKSSSDGIDVLRKVPSVQIDYLNEDIKVEGKSNIVIEVDGIRREKSYLKKLNPKEIDKFEINNSPSGKYDPETDAVINIITNPNMRYGLKGMFTSQILPGSDNYQRDLNANLDYGLEKVTYYIGGYGVSARFGNFSSTYRESASGILNQTSDNVNKYGYTSLNAGFNFDPKKYDILNFDFSFSRNTSDGNTTKKNSFTDNELYNIYRTFSKSEGNYRNLNTSLFYKHKFDKEGKHNIEAETRYYSSLNSSNKNAFQNIYYSENDVETYQDPVQYEETNTNSQSANARIGYTLPFDSVYVFGAGVNANLNLYDLENSSSVSSASNLNYTDFRSAGYVDLLRNLKMGSIKLGVRFETSNVTINSSSKSQYFSFLPYANASYKFNNTQNVRLSYTRRVIRPSTSDLNPFVSVVDSTTISHGNANLEPGYRDNFQFTYSYRYGKGKYSVTLSPQIFYDFKTHMISRIYKDLGNNKVELVPENISNGYETGAGISVNTQLAVVSISTYFRYVYYHVDSYKDQILAVNQNGWMWNVNVMSPLFLKINFMGYFNMMSPSISGQQEYRNEPMYYLGLQRQVLKTGSIRLMAINPFGDYVNKSSTITRSESLYQRTDSHMMIKNAILLTLTYNFKSGKDVSSQKNSGGQQDNSLPMSF